ncbi:MAG: Mov34/MPN/PAD-1 family protein [Bacteroidetes bacterium]|nr:Mov34/MPN/PAD-1 family protein [Bacteroidota bacterium]
MKSVIQKIKFSREAMDVFCTEIAEWGTIETGGVLVGYIENDIIYIAKASSPGPNAIHDIASFQADANYVDMFIDMESANSAGRYQYIGEWHTHPQIEPTPSDTDLISLKEIADTSTDFALVFIIGAIDFKKEFLNTQSVCVIKFLNDPLFYQLEVEI